MAYDVTLAERIRTLIASTPNVTERKMFGGLAFLVNGNMAIAASGQGGLLVRVDPAQTGVLLKTGVQMMEMRGKSMPGWLRIKTEHITDDNTLAEWVERSTTYALSLLPKT